MVIQRDFYLDKLIKNIMIKLKLLPVLTLSIFDFLLDRDAIEK